MDWKIRCLVVLFGLELHSLMELRSKGAWEGIRQSDTNNPRATVLDAFMGEGDSVSPFHMC